MGTGGFLARPFHPGLNSPSDCPGGPHVGDRAGGPGGAGVTGVPLTYFFAYPGVLRPAVDRLKQL